MAITHCLKMAEITQLKNGRHQLNLTLHILITLIKILYASLSH